MQNLMDIMSFNQENIGAYHQVPKRHGYSQYPHTQPVAGLAYHRNENSRNVPALAAPTLHRDMYSDMIEFSIRHLQTHIASNGGTSDALQSSPIIQEMTLGVMLRLIDMGKYPEGGLRQVFPKMSAGTKHTFWNNNVKDETEMETPRPKLRELQHTNAVRTRPQASLVYNKQLQVTTKNELSHLPSTPMRSKIPYANGRSSIGHSIVKNEPNSHPFGSSMAVGSKYNPSQNGRPGKFRTSYQKSGAPRPNRQLALTLGYPGVQKYQGDPKTVIENASCPADINCAIWMSQIPTWVTTKDIFATITEGKVWSYYKVDPVPGRFEKCGAKIVFQERYIAEKYLNKCLAHGLKFGEEAVKVEWNRNPVYPCRPDELNSSRVLRVSGQYPEVNCKDLVADLKKEMEFELQEENRYMEYNTLTTGIELVFDKVVGQSRQAMALIMDIIRTNGYDWKVQYGPDPCDQTNYDQQMFSGTQAQRRIA
ncbi:hypothetical protein HYFRA_00002458 [Hymenoscyphus fraxineus]|uniref:Uncharacterized protein n=1 Tax=Hymenoscyphus fraxineus TaxID=746836 RepID=A0A9N9PZ06_9HELO|nr:hypothetical protein HYFRA_00002458 [Hymenoscyphus fraxineus]